MFKDNNQQQRSRDGLPDEIEAFLNRNVLFWFVAWLATVLSGAIYPTLEGHDMLLVFCVGAIAIGLFAIPILLTFAVVTWALWLTRFRIFTASLAGGMSCAVAAVRVLNASGAHLSVGWKLIAMEALFGSIGCLSILCLFGWWTAFREETETKAPWQFTMKDLFVHFTVLALLISLWSVLFPFFRDFITSSLK